MIIVLPPSETKTRPASGPALDLGGLHDARRLAEPRSTMLRAAQRTAHSPRGMVDLGIPAGSPELLERMVQLEEEPTAPALDVYSGVLYDALDGARPQQEGQVLVTSALFGVVDAADRIPAYRLSAGSRVSRLGTAGSWWRTRLAVQSSAISRRGGLIIDCRSGAYRSMMPITGAVEVSAVREVKGRRSVISHEAKRYRGVLAALLLREASTPREVSEVVEIARTALPDELSIEVEERTLVIVDHG